jgi:hypothetical protein
MKCNHIREYRYSSESPMINKAVLFVFKTAYGTTVSQSKFHLKLVACIIWTGKVLSGFLKGFIYISLSNNMQYYKAYLFTTFVIYEVTHALKKSAVDFYK